MELTARQEQARDVFIDVRGTWNDTWEAMVRLDPGFLESYARFSGVPFRDGGDLDPKIKELIFIAIDGAATHLYLPGLRSHIRRAIELGATKEELSETLQLTATLGIHAANIGVPLLMEVLQEEGLRDGPAPLDARQEALKADFTETRGYWHEFWAGILELDPDLFEAYLEFSGHPWKHGVLDPKTKELIYCAFDCAATHLYVPGLKLHMKNALGYGATVGEIMEVIEIASTIGIHACTEGAPILVEELRAAGQDI
jgi:alkylhydroperoxidase/carboxymuconolactone decarboxylase family protein YurZ